MTTRQIFCTLNELDADLELNGSEREDKVWAKIKAASDFLLKEIGHFIPVTIAWTIKGSGEERLYLPGGLLSVTSIVNDGTTLTASDYMLMPSQRAWPNGPYTWLDVAEDATNLSEWCEDKDGVVITGPWGLFTLTEDTGADVGTGGQTNSATSLLTTNGAKFSPGAVLLIGTEQELVTATGDPSDSTANLGAAITDEHDYIITLDDASKINIGEIIRIDLEQMKVRDRNTSTNQLYLERGWNKTLKATHSNSADVYVYRTFTVERGVNGTTAASHNAAVDISRQVVPDDINFLCRQIAGKMLKMAQSGFAGRIGDISTGEAIYQFAIPRDELERIKRNYMIHTAG